ncbi:MAG: ribonuclease [Desulfomicrobiaceae bacterium]|nr:ribonuclease [Desulfomicrobiaceae bacterium]
MAASSVTITPLGGFGEIGMNCLALETPQSMLVVDCGLMFPDAVLYGVDVVIPRLDFIFERRHKLAGIVLTHGHEDHIGALPWLLPGLSRPQVYGSELTLRLVLKKLQERGQEQLWDPRPVRAGDRVEIGDVACTFIAVCHSIVEGFGLGLETPAGRMIHTGDFKLDPTPLGGHATDLEAFARFAQPGVQLLLADSTNVEREGHSLSEREIQATLDEVIRQAPGRVLVTLFSSHIQRIQEILDIAAAQGRTVAFTGRSLSANMEIARDLGLLRMDPGRCHPLELLPASARDRAIILLTGSQGEPLSALSRVARGEHRQLAIEPGDLVILSSSFIPGNTRAITRVINDLYRLGATVLHEKIQAIHASGHAHREELATMIRTVQPKFFVPLHGEYRHLVKHAQLAVECGVAPERALVLEDGHPVTLMADGRIRLEDPVSADSVLVDGKGVGDVGQSVLKERQILAGEGMVVALLVQDEYGTVVFGPSLQSKGFIFEQQFAHLLQDAQCLILDIVESDPRQDARKMEDRIRQSLRRFFRNVLDRDPIVVPIVVRV